MAIPSDVTSIIVTGTYVDAAGVAATGTVSFTPSGWTASAGDDTVVAPSAVLATLDETGAFSVTLQVTDDASLQPSPWQYSVEERINGQARSFSVNLPSTLGATVDMADLAPALPVGEAYYSLVSSLAIGTVTTVAAGGSATATITGTAPNQTLNLGIPTGATGAIGSFGAGSASAPSVRPDTDTNTGLFFPAADTLAVSTGGSERLRVSATGLAVGTSTQTALVDVYSASGASAVLRGDAAVTSRMSRSSTDSAGPVQYLDKRRGTDASPSVVAASDIAGRIIFRAYDGTTMGDVAEIRAFIDGTPGSGDTPGALSFRTTVDGSSGTTERMRIDNAGLITGTGTSLGAWTAYTPTWSSTGTAPAIGNGTITGYYVQIGKVVHFRVVLTLGSTSTVGTGAWTFTLPLTGTAVNQGFLGTAFIWDASASAAYTAILERSSSTVFFLRSTGAATARVSGTAPFTWTPADADYAQITGTYEIA